MKSLEELMQYFVGEETAKPYVPLFYFGSGALNERGAKAYDKLVEFLYDVSALTERTDIDGMITVLDSIASEQEE